METHEKVLLATILGVFTFAIFSVTHPYSESNPFVIDYQSKVCVYKNGDLLSCNPNTITNNGKDMILTSLRNGTVNRVTMLALGNGTTPVVAAVNITGRKLNCGLASGDGTYTKGTNNGNWTWSKTWTSSCNTQVLNVTGLYRNNSLLFAGAAFTTTTLQSGDQITVNYNVWIT